jgi:hypothetical protein
MRYGIQVLCPCYHRLWHDLASRCLRLLLDLLPGLASLLQVLKVHLDPGLIRRLIQLIVVHGLSIFLAHTHTMEKRIYQACMFLIDIIHSSSLKRLVLEFYSRGAAHAVALIESLRHIHIDRAQKGLSPRQLKFFVHVRLNKTTLRSSLSCSEKQGVPPSSSATLCLFDVGFD